MRVHMERADMPFVSVIGGFYQFDQKQAANAKATAQIIGAELAKAGFGLVVYFSDDKSLEPHVVSGYASAKAGGRIRIRYAESQRGQVKFKEQDTRPELFDPPILFPSQDWEAPFYRSLAEEEGVDAVLLLGGATSTLIAGQIAVARGLPIMAIDEFGGSAAKIWTQLAQAAPTKVYSWGSRTPAYYVEQLKAECSARAERRKEASRRDSAFAQIVSQHRKTVYAALAFFVLLLALFFGMVYTPWPKAYTMVLFTGLISAGATGALVRVVLWGPKESDPRTSLLLGSVAGIVVGLAYLIPQWIGAPGVLTPASDVVSATDKIQFASAVLVAMSAGVGFDTVFNKLQQQAQHASVSPPQ
jgi:hypothetical protein